jgi:hypothetical protein
MAHLPHWVWLVEMQVRAQRQRDPRSAYVIADWVFDSTAHDDVPLERLYSLTSASGDATEVGQGEERLWSPESDGRSWRSLISDPDLASRYSRS